MLVFVYIANFMTQCGSDIVWELVFILYHFCTTKTDDFRAYATFVIVYFRSQ